MKEGTISKYAASRARALARLRAEHLQIDTYAAKENHNAEAVRIRRAALEALAEMIDEADAALAAMKESTDAAVIKIRKEADTREKEAYQLGKEEAEARANAKADAKAKPEELPPQYFGASKEAVRELRRKEVQAAWPELFGAEREQQNKDEIYTAEYYV